MDPLAERYSAWSGYNYVMGNPVNAVDLDGRDAVIVIDKENRTISVSQKFHVSLENVRQSIERVQNNDGTGTLTLGDLLGAIQADFAEQWGNVKSAEVDGEEYSVSFSLTIVSHETIKERDDALSEDKTSNKLEFAKSLSKAGIWVNGERTMKLGVLEMIQGTFSHEIGHSLGIAGHISGSGEITSYDTIRNVKAREVNEVLQVAVDLAKKEKGNVIAIHRTAHKSEEWQRYDPTRVIKK